MNMVQTKLVHGNTKLTCWVAERKDLRVGSFITLKDFNPKTRWEVVELGRKQDSSLIHKDWKVGGLDGSRS